jgi:outer membrane protein assembly factor BamD
VITQYQTTRHVEEALMRLTETYMSLGIVNEAQTAAAVLGHNFPDSPWYKDAYRLVRGGGFEPNEDQGSWISKAFRKVGLGFAAEPRKPEPKSEDAATNGAFKGLRLR